jgi:site-specific DNA-methyltransferase (adenine-specific)
MDKKPISIAECKDCMEVMRGFPDKFFELSVVDPPYGIGQDGRTNHSRGLLAKSKDYRSNSRYDFESPNKEYWDELFRVSKNQIIWGANHYISKIPFDSSCWIVWDKMNGETDFADCELAWTSFKTAVRIFKFRWQGMLQGDMKNKEERIHPNQKPTALYQWLLKNYAKPGDKILDTHLGSGRSRIAAYKMGFDFWGYEIDKDYFEAQEKCFKRATPLTIFDLMGEPEVNKPEINKLF